MTELSSMLPAPSGMALSDVQQRREALHREHRAGVHQRLIAGLVVGEVVVPVGGADLPEQGAVRRGPENIIENTRV